MDARRVTLTGWSRSPKRLLGPGRFPIPLIQQKGRLRSREGLTVPILQMRRSKVMMHPSQLRTGD